MSRSYFYIFLILLITFAGCKTRKVTTAPRADAEEMKARALLNNVLENEFKYSYLSGKIKIDYESEERTQGVKADIRMKKDSAIWISVTPAFGLEVARVLVTPDSVHILDRLNKRYYTHSIDYLSQLVKAPVDFYMLQSLLTGGIIYFENQPLLSDISDRSNILISESEVLKNVIYIIPSLYKVEKMELTHKEEDKNLNVNYSVWTDVEGQRFPMKRSAVMTGNDRVKVDVEYSKVKINEPLQFPFVVSDSYEVIR